MVAEIKGRGGFAFQMEGDCFPQVGHGGKEQWGHSGFVQSSNEPEPWPKGSKSPTRSLRGGR
jgi:hypothetical protein